MKSVDIAFLFPPGGETQFFQYHLGVAYVQAFLQAHGIISKQIVPPILCTVQECIDFLLETDPKVVGFTCFDVNYRLVRTMAAHVKQRRPECVVLAGGPSATFSDELILEHTPDIDVCVRFEGEETTLELISLLLEGVAPDCLDAVAGISFRRQGTIVRTRDRPLFRHGVRTWDTLDGLPSPFIAGILDGTEGTGILTARGCTHRCTYCNFSAMSRHTIRYHSADRIVAELRIIQATREQKPTIRRAQQIVAIYDDAFTLNPERAKAICRRIVDEGIKLPLNCMCRADTLDEELVDLLYQAGITQISFGLESAVPRVLRNIKKVYRRPPKSDVEDYSQEKRFLEQVQAGVFMAKRKKLLTLVSIILGLPGETYEDGLRTIDFVRRMKVDHYAHNFLSACPGTEIFENARNYGIEVKPSIYLLPYMTRHAYPVETIPFDANSSRYQHAATAARNILRAFSGGEVNQRCVAKGIVFAVVEAGSSPDFSRSLAWLAPSIAMGGKAILLRDARTTLANWGAIRRAVAAAELPSTEWICLNRHDMNDQAAVYEPFPRRESSWPFHFQIIPFSRCREFYSEQKESERRDCRIYCFRNNSDVAIFSALSDSVNGFAKGDSTDAGIWLDGILLDGCRWNRGTCPALQLHRVVINKNGEIRPCLTGQPLGTVADRVERLRERARSLHAKVCAERQCSACLAEPRCAKCLFPYPITVKQYCELQRNSPKMASVVIRANIGNTFDPWSREEI